MLSDLIGKYIEDIQVSVNLEPYGLDTADSIIILRDNLIIGIPWSIDISEEVERTDLVNEARSIFTDKKNKLLLSIKGKRIVDFLKYPNSEAGFVEAEKAIIELENEKFITERTIAPHGTGLAGLWVFHSREELEERHGTCYKRWSDDKGSA